MIEPEPQHGLGSLDCSACQIKLLLNFQLPSVLWIIPEWNSKVLCCEANKIDRLILMRPRRVGAVFGVGVTIGGTLVAGRLPIDILGLMPGSTAAARAGLRERSVDLQETKITKQTIGRKVGIWKCLKIRKWGNKDIEKGVLGLGASCPAWEAARKRRVACCSSSLVTDRAIASVSGGIPLPSARSTSGVVPGTPPSGRPPGAGTAAGPVAGAEGRGAARSSPRHSWKETKMLTLGNAFYGNYRKHILTAMTRWNQ